MSFKLSCVIAFVILAKHGTTLPRTSQEDTHTGNQTMGSGPEKVEQFMKTMIDDIPAFLRFMEAIGYLRWMQVPKEKVELNTDKYSVADKIPQKDGNIEPIGYIAAAMKGLLEKESVQNQELSQFFGALPNNQLLTFIRDMKVAASVSDMVQLALRSTSLQNILQQAVKSMPFLKELITDIRNKNLQDRVLIDVLMGKMPSTTDFTAMTDNHLHYSLDAFINAMKDNQYFQKILEKTLDTKIDVHEGLKLLTGETLHLNGDPDHNGKYTVTSVDIDQNNFLAQYGTTFLFLVENFSKIVQIIDTYNTASPDLVKIVGLVLGLDTSMLQAAPKGPLPPLKSQVSMPFRVSGPHLVPVVHTAVSGTSHMVLKNLTDF